MKTLILCRHAKSDWNRDLDDFHRPLNSRGKKDAKRMAELFFNSGFSADLIITSPAIRALTTAQAFASALGLEKKLSTEPSIYESSTGKLISVIQSLPDSADTVMIFGHNPTMEQTAAYLLQTESTVTMPTCAMICLDNISSWNDIQPGSLNLKWFLIPKLIRPGSEGED